MAIPPTIQEGDSGPVVRWAQYRLVYRPLSYTDIDGIFGPKTKNAVEAFQQQAQLTVDGIVGPHTWAALCGNKAEPPTLEQGSTGNIVRLLQTALNDGRGDFSPDTSPPLAVDGDFGPKTAAEVEGAQKMGSIPSDGIVGVQTWALPVHAAGQVLANLCNVTGPNGE
jgi:peptidoglycan hydrolase-like protein with peptidoglycan-binding domain